MLSFLYFCLLFTLLFGIQGESTFSEKMFGSTHKQTNKQTTTTTTEGRNGNSDIDLYTNNLEIFAKRVINFFLNECEYSIESKQPCLLLRELNIPSDFYTQFWEKEQQTLVNKQTLIHEFFDTIQYSEILNLEQQNLTIYKEQQNSINKFLISLMDSLPISLLVSYGLFCVLMVYIVLKATFHKLSVLSIMFSLFLFTFLVSVPYEYMRLYHEAIGERNAKLAQTIPADCLQREQSYWSTFLSQFSFHDNTCLEWHLALTSSPLLMVSPATAFSVAFANFFTGPFVEISRAFSKAFTALLVDIPMQWQLPLLGIAFVLLLVTLCIGCGYSFNFTPLISFRPSRGLAPREGGVVTANLGGNVPLVPREIQHVSPVKVELTIVNPVATTRDARMLVYTQAQPEVKLEPEPEPELEPEVKLEPELEPDDLRGKETTGARNESDKENIPPNILRPRVKQENI